MPVYEIVKTIGKLIGVENTKELSLAFPSSIDKNEVSISHMNWLDVTKSLNAQGIEDGDMVLLRYQLAKPNKLYYTRLKFTNFV
jgi:hypothetical protein